MKIRTVIRLVLAFILLNACVQELPFGVKEAEVPVVNCILINDSVQTLSLTKSVKITDSYVFKEIKDAQITLCTDSVIIGEFERIGYGNWQLRFRPVAGMNYRLKVRLSDGKELSATTTMPERNLIVADNEKNLFPSKYFRQQTASSPCWVFILSEEKLTENLIHPIPSSSASLRPDIGTDHPLVDRFNEDGNLFDLVSQATTPAYAFYVRIQPSQLNKAEDISFCLQTNYGLYTFIFFRTVSKEYDQYMKSSLLKMFVYRSEDDPIQWFDENRVFSNINNGTGIFAAYNEDCFYFFDGNMYVEY